MQVKCSIMVIANRTEETVRRACAHHRHKYVCRTVLEERDKENVGRVMGIALRAAFLTALLFCAGGDSKFGLICGAATLWCVIIPAGMAAAFVFKAPVPAVYVLLSMDEIVKLPVVYGHYRKYKWVRNVTGSGPDARRAA